jgi:hypothetical protein
MTQSMLKQFWRQLVMPAVLIFACLQAAGCVPSVDGGQSGISPRLESTGILYIDVMNIRGDELVGREIIIDGHTHVSKGRPDFQGEAEFGSHSRLPQERLEAIWLAADDFMRTTTEPWTTAWQPTKGRLRPGIYMDICVEGRDPHGDYLFQWPPGQEPSDPKARKLLALLKEADALDKQAKYSPFRLPAKP